MIMRSTAEVMTRGWARSVGKSCSSQGVYSKLIGWSARTVSWGSKSISSGSWLVGSAWSNQYMNIGRFW